MSSFFKLAYGLGQAEALGQLGMPRDADAFTEMVGQENENPSQVEELAPVNDEDKPTHWGGGASLEGGDVGTRLEQMGLPVSGAV